MSRALALVALTHLSYMHSEHPFMLELASSPLVKLPCSPPRTIPAFGRLAHKWWLHELSGWRQRRQHFGTLRTINGLCAVGVGSSSKLAEAPEHRLSCTAVQALLSSGSWANLQRLACGLYSMDQHGWKLCRCVLGALGKDQLSSCDAAAIRWSAVAA